MPIKVVRGIGYAYWASYLVNGDPSGISDDERRDADAFAEWLGGSIVDVGEDTFFGRPDFGSSLYGDVTVYTSHHIIDRKES